MPTIEKLLEKVANTPLSAIVALRVNLVKKGKHYFGVCPFHEDHTIGSFSVNDEKHIAKCFSCNGGSVDSISFICKTDKINRKDALFRICYELNYITEEEYKASNTKSYNFTNYKVPTTIIKDDKDKDIADKDILDLVYKIISRYGDKLNGGDDVLSEEHRDYLHKRGINDKEILKNNYFTMPTRRAVVNIVKKLTAFGLNNEALKYVPGFYYNKERNFFTLRPYKGIGIPIKNIKGEIQGIQCRRDGEIKPGEQRYFWWSSCSEYLGASPGCPLDILIPTEIKANAIFITEGHFKADAIIKKYLVPCISVQGINNWKLIPKELSNFPDINSAWICYDADMAYNKSVIEQALKLAESIIKLHNMKVYFVVWDYHNGKGIDDAIELNTKLKKIEFSDFSSRYNKFIQLKTDDKEELFNEFKNIFLDK